MMWKIIFKYADKSKCTITGKQKDISLELALKYCNQYGKHTAEAIYQKYPKKDNEPVALYEKIWQLESEVLTMKGYTDDFGIDRPPCKTCKHKNKMTVEAPCYNCIDTVDLALHKPNNETEFANYESEVKE